ncbi:MAG: DegQ family serine endoprotease [Desulfarculaceae bacterium]|jgi:serine protease Do
MLSSSKIYAAAAGLLVALALVLTGVPMASAQERPDSFAALAKKVAPAVINIRTVKTVKTAPMPDLFQYRRPGPGDKDEKGQIPDLHEFFRRFFGGPGGPSTPREFKQRSLGSGVIIDKQGYALTNNHVIAGADEILVKLKNGKELEAEIVGRDKKTDLALIRIKTKKDMPFLTLGNSDALQVGDWVLAVGNPFGLENTVTAGIVSAKGRIIGAGPYDNFIQTDASINPGNSGGPLINLKGEVVGINTAIVAHGQGIGFAIPVNLARQVMDQLRTKGRVVRGWLGVLIQPVTKDLAQKFGLKDAKGALVAKVVPGSPADKAGLKRGDVIVEFEGKPVEDSHRLPGMVAQTPVGTEVKLKIVREGHSRPINVTLGELEEEKLKAQTETQKEIQLGMSLQKLTPPLAKQFGISGKKGLIITSVQPGGPAAEAGLVRGDVILEAANKPVEDLDEFQSLADKLKPGDGLLLLIQRRGGTLFVVVKAPK